MILTEQLSVILNLILFLGLTINSDIRILI